jgi:dihydroxyacetone kinase-like predicted kinase
MSGTTSPSHHNGHDLRGMFAVATSCLEREADAVNSINVFPVPDSDTGTNMYLTMRAAMEEAFHAKSVAAGTVAQAIAHGALMGGYGKSGIILTQILSGIADGLSEKDSFSGADFAEALEMASAKAYRAVSQPVEGTILTVMREGAAAAKRKVRRAGSTLKSVLAGTVEAAREAVANTPSLLPVLREAGVVDAGGQGLYVMLDGALRYVRRDSGPPLALAAGNPEASWLAATASLHEKTTSYYSYCTEFLLKGDDLDSDSVLAGVRDEHQDRRHPGRGGGERKAIVRRLRERAHRLCLGSSSPMRRPRCPRCRALRGTSTSPWRRSKGPC